MRVRQQRRQGRDGVFGAVDGQLLAGERFLGGRGIGFEQADQCALFGKGGSLALGSGSQGWIQLIAGEGDVDGQALHQGDGLGFSTGTLNAFTAGPVGADLLLFELR